MSITGTPKLRDWQIAAHSAVLDAWKEGASKKALVAACPGSGKTLFTTTLIRDLFRDEVIDFVIVLVPTVNIKLQWVKALKKAELSVPSCGASNEAFRWRRDENICMHEGHQVVVLTYAQLAQDSELHVVLAQRSGKVLVIGDEIHHADDDATYGAAVQKLAEVCYRSLALSGTPFNTKGGALALCDHKSCVDDEGKPVRRTKATYSYDYGRAILDKEVCRPVEFTKISGKGVATYRLLSDNSTLTRITDLAAQRESDNLSVLLDPDGEFMEECARQAIRTLKDMRDAGDRLAAMLVVAKSKEHGARMTEMIARVCEAEYRPLVIQQIYNDSPSAHQRIGQLEDDTTDIVVSVRMISEGVDVKRLRVGLFATDTMTIMFFIQFVGRFARWEKRLGEGQFASIIIPAHKKLLEYALEIEKLVETAAISEGEDGEEGIGKMKVTEFLGSETSVGEKGVIYRSEESMKLDLAEAFFNLLPHLRGKTNVLDAIKAAEKLNLDGARPDSPKPIEVDWGSKNDLMTRSIVKRLKEVNGKSDNELFARVQRQANRAVGIIRKDKLTPKDVLIKRHAYLQQWLLRLMHGQDTSGYNAQP